MAYGQLLVVIFFFFKHMNLIIPEYTVSYSSVFQKLVNGELYNKKDRTGLSIPLHLALVFQIAFKMHP